MRGTRGGGRDHENPCEPRRDTGQTRKWGDANEKQMQSVPSARQEGKPCGGKRGGTRDPEAVGAQPGGHRQIPRTDRTMERESKSEL